jgi:hypothetical protein
MTSRCGTSITVERAYVRSPRPEPQGVPASRGFAFPGPGFAGLDDLAAVGVHLVQVAATSDIPLVFVLLE